MKNNNDDGDNQQWSQAYLKDQFFLRLSEVPDPNLFYQDRKYYALAKKLMFKIPVYKSSPTFVFNISDLDTKCREEFIGFVKLNPKREIEYFLKDIAVKFLESVNYSYTNNSVIPYLQVGYDD
jgi:hypothetical protein